VTAMDDDAVRTLAEEIRASYAPERLETGVREPTVVELPDGSRAVTLPRDQMFEPYRSFRLIDAAALGGTLVVAFSWDDGRDDGTVFVMPLDCRNVDLDVSDEFTVTTFLTRFLEFTLGGPRESWEPARSTPLGPRLAIVRPWGSD
jgi:hypothetical protein